MEWKLYLYLVETNKGILELKLKQAFGFSHTDTVTNFVHAKFPALTIKNITFKGAVSNA